MKKNTSTESVTRYTCDYCGDFSTDETVVADHEPICKYNPKTQGCVTCCKGAHYINAGHVHYRPDHHKCDTYPFINKITGIGHNWHTRYCCSKWDQASREQLEKQLEAVRECSEMRRKENG